MWSLSTLLRRWSGDWLGAADGLAFPMFCAICEAEGTEGPYCAPCVEELLGASEGACPRCALTVGPYADVQTSERRRGRRLPGCGWCRNRALGFDAALALGPYQGPIRDACLALKHERNAWLAPWLVSLLIEAHRSKLAHEDSRGAVPLVVPVPLHWWRRHRRGYNQAEALARHFADRLHWEFRQPLKRVRATDHLVGLSRRQRALCLRDAFAVRGSTDLAGRTVYLVDDILTTGATCGAAARCLKRAGAGWVVAVVIGRAEERRGRMSDAHANKPLGLRETSGPVRIGTRGSPLARWQASWVADQLRRHHPGLAVELVEIRTLGDRDRNSPLAAIGGQGLFTKEIQLALLERRVEIAVHSLKDLPTQAIDGLCLAAVPPREDLADALIAPVHRTLDALPSGSRVGTGSQRRRAQLLHLRPDLQVVGVRGNVETRLRQALDGALDAVVLAVAGLHRLGLDGHITERLEPPRFLPAVGQGALGIECRADDTATRALLEPLDDPQTRRAVIAERRVLAELEGGCSIPLAAWGRDTAGELILDAAVFDPEGCKVIRASEAGPIEAPEALGVQVARRLREGGAGAILGRDGSTTESQGSW